MVAPSTFAITMEPLVAKMDLIALGDLAPDLQKEAMLNFCMSGD